VFCDVEVVVSRVGSGHGSESIEVPSGQCVTISVFTRSTAGAKFSIHDSSTKSEVVSSIEVKHDDSALPTTSTLAEDIKGPVSLKVKADSNAGRFSTHNYLLVFSMK